MTEKRHIFRANPSQKEAIKKIEAEFQKIKEESSIIYYPEDCSYNHCVWLIQEKLINLL